MAGLRAAIAAGTLPAHVTQFREERARMLE
jgi:hypothetical protein